MTSWRAPKIRMSSAGTNDYQYRYYDSIVGIPEENPEIISVSMLLQDNLHAMAPFNRNIDDFSMKDKSDRLFNMMTTKSVQTMIRKEIRYRTRGGLYSKSRPLYFLFDGNHRFALSSDFFNGLCYVIVPDEEGIKHYCWVSQEAKEKADHDKLGYDAQYADVLCPELRIRLMNCKIQMISLPPRLSDAEAYDRARIANQCKPLEIRSQIKCLCSKETKAADLLTSLSSPSPSPDENLLFGFLLDDIYTCNASLINLVSAHDILTDFSELIVKLKRLDKISGLIDTYEPSTCVVRSMNKAKQDTEHKLCKALGDIHPPLKKWDNSHKSAVALMYISLFLAMLNVNCGSISDEFVGDEHVLTMLEKFIALQSYEKGENHRRMYKFFRTGTFPALSKKRHAE